MATPKDLLFHPRYQFKSHLGKGSYGMIVLAFCSKLKEDVAVKIVPKKDKHGNEQKTSEASIHRSLDDQNVVKFLNSYESNTHVYLVMEYAVHGSMEDLLNSRKTVTEPEMRLFVQNILSGLKHLAAERVVHSDLKPGNVLLFNGLKPKISDFGLAFRLKEGQETDNVGREGTIFYMSPEQLRGSVYGCKANVFSCGCIGYQLLVGRTPIASVFGDGIRNQIAERLEKGRIGMPQNLSDPGKKLLQKLLAAKPKDRLSAAEALEDVFFKQFIHASIPVKKSN